VVPLGGQLTGPKRGPWRSEEVQSGVKNGSKTGQNREPFFGSSGGSALRTNTKIQAMKRQAYGFRDQEFFKLEILAIHETEYALAGYRDSIIAPRQRSFSAIIARSTL
jgi:hypothetical protein